MKKHTKIYFKHFGIGEQDFVKCEVSACYKRATEIHHIDSKGLGGTSIDKDYIENLVAVCREHHERAHADKNFNAALKTNHLNNLQIFATFGKT